MDPDKDTKAILVPSYILSIPIGVIGLLFILPETVINLLGNII